MAWPISPRCAPGSHRLDAAPHRGEAGLGEALRDARGALPTKYMRLVSPWKPSRITVTSMLTMSPAFSRRSFGMPWQTTWLTEVQMVFGKPR